MYINVAKNAVTAAVVIHNLFTCLHARIDSTPLKRITPPDQKLKAAVLRRCTGYEKTAQLPIPMDEIATITWRAPKIVSTQIRSFLAQEHRQLHLVIPTESCLSIMTQKFLQSVFG